MNAVLDRRGAGGCRRTVMLAFAAVAGVVVTACNSASDPERPQPPRVVTTASPARAFAPLVHLHRSEQWWPMSTDRFLGFGMLAWKNAPCPANENIAIGGPRLRAGHDLPITPLRPSRLGGPNPYSHRPMTADCKGRRSVVYSTAESTRPFGGAARARGLRPAEGFYIDVLTDHRDGDPRFARRDGQLYLRPVPVYFERLPARVKGSLAWRFLYWMFYGGSRPIPAATGSALQHEGDWERISVLVRQTGPTRFLPVSIRYYARAGHRDVPWRSIEVVSDDRGRPTSHPIVYSARGGHEPYPQPVRRRVRVNSPNRGELVAIDDAEACADCARWETWDLVRPVQRQDWYGYGGGWGYAFTGSEDSGPAGPAPHSEISD